MADKDTLAEAQDAFKEAVDYESDNRKRMVENVRFVDLAEQWPDEVKRRRELAHRPCLTINKLPSFIRQVVNDSRQNKPAITVAPVDSQSDPETAEILSGLIRHIERHSHADIAYDTAVEWAVKSGIGYFTVGVDYADDTGFEQEITISRVVSPFSIYGDPNSESGDGSDWKCAFQVMTYSEDEVRERYQTGRREVTSWDAGGTGDVETREDIIRVARYWKVTPERRQLVMLSNGGAMFADDITDEQMAMFNVIGITPTERTREVIVPKVRYYILSGNAVLEEGDWAGRYIPIVPVYGTEFWIDGRRHWKSLVHDAIDAQRMFNYWRSASTEMVALAPKSPYVGPKGAFKTDAKKWNSAHIDNWPYLQYDGEVPPQRQPFPSAPAGALQEALNASDDIKAITGMYDASLGARSNETSGRAIIARQREADVGTYHFIDNLTRAIRYAGRIIIDMIPKVYDTPRMLRVLGKDEQLQQVQVNQPTTYQGVERVFDLTVGRYDVTVTAGPSYTTQRQEAAQQMVELIRAYPDAAPIIGDLVAKNLDWPGAEEIAARLKAMLPPQIQALEQDGKQVSPEAAQAMAQAQQAMQMVQAQAQQAQQLMAQAEQEKSAAEKAKAEIKTMIADLKTQQAELKAAEANLRANVAEAGAQIQQREMAVVSQAEQVARQAETSAQAGQQSAADMVQQALQVVTERIAALENSVRNQPIVVQSGGSRRRVKVNRDQLGNLMGAEIEDEE